MSRRPHGTLATRLVRLLRSRRSEEACAAAIVIGALRPAEPSVGRELARRLRLNDPIRFYVLEALARQKTDDACEHVVRALVRHGPDREHARRLLKSFGPRALAILGRALEANPVEAQIIYSSAAGFRTRAAVAWLMRRLARASPGHARLIYLAVRRDMNEWPRRLRAYLRTWAMRLVRPGAGSSRSAVLAA